MRKLGRLILVLTLFWGGVAILPAAISQSHNEATPVAIVGVTLIDGNGGTPLSNATVVVADGKRGEVGE